MKRWTAATITMALISAALPGAQQTTRPFRSSAEAVLLPVSVSDRNRAVVGLAASDFELLDNGVPQTITASVIEGQPLDVTLVLDTSGSVTGPMLAQFRTDVQTLSSLLQVNDRVRLITFGTSASEVSGPQPGGAVLPLGEITSGGATAFYGALAAALLAYPQTDRPNLVFGFSDGVDNSSFMDADRLVALAGRSGASLFVALEPPTMTVARGVLPYLGGPNIAALKAATARTGGALYDGMQGNLVTLFKQVLEDFRSSYMLSYVPSGLTPNGWHEITVNVKGKAFVVRARKGYDGGVGK